MSDNPLMHMLATLGDEERPLDAIPYAQHLNLHVRREGGDVIVRMAYHPDLIGAPARLHGGAVCGFLEITSALAVWCARNTDPAAATFFPKPVNITINYLRAGAPEDTYANATVIRLGRTIAHVCAQAWQQDRTKPIATAFMNLVVS